MHVDPVIYRTKMSSEAFVWSEALAGKPVSRAAKRVMNEATEFGMFDGYSVPLHSVGGFRRLSPSAHARSTCPAEQRGALHIIFNLCAQPVACLHGRWERTQCAAAVAKSHAAGEGGDPVVCSGQDQWEIGQILGISEKTVQHEIASASRKLNSVKPSATDRRIDQARYNQIIGRNGLY